jgi:S-adenosylmethionine synthetase
VQSFIISALDASADDVEVVERKGIGHPDTICDALAETLSRNLCREYRDRFGDVLHHNVDKALLRGGSAAPAFGGGMVLEPISIYLAGRSMTEVGGPAFPVDEIAIEGSRAWIRAHMHALDADRHVRIHNLIRPGSQDLQELYSRGQRSKVALANDTTVGVGYAPMSGLEQLVLAVERHINSREPNRQHPAWGEDVKIMGVRCGKEIKLTVACAMIGRYLSHLDDYIAKKLAIEALSRNLAVDHGFPECPVHVNPADNLQAGVVYLTVTGTSAEAGDDGQVGRGNRLNGLITPYRPMIIEAVAGKNPVTHTGKIYNVVAGEIAAALVAEEPDIVAAQCLLLSEIGAPVTEPALLHLRLATRDGLQVANFEKSAKEIARDHLERIPEMTDAFITGKISIF